MLIFRALSALLSYPTQELRQALPEIARIVQETPHVRPRERAELLDLIAEMGRGDLLSAEERYVDLFDRGRALSLNLFEHLHGDSRDRGTAMVELRQLYANAGFDLATSELPDFLPVVLEYLSCRDIDEARDMLADCAHILASIARSLAARRSQYLAVLHALLLIAGEEPVDTEKVPPARDHHEALDRDWAERPAFADGPAGNGQPANQGR